MLTWKGSQAWTQNYRQLLTYCWEKENQSLRNEAPLIGFVQCRMVSPIYTTRQLSSKMFT